MTFSPPSAILPPFTNNFSSTALEREFLTKRRRLEEGWADYTATDDQSVDMPPSLIHMLNDNKFVSEPRSNFLNTLQNAQPGQLITMPGLGACPKGFGEGYPQNSILVTEQMIEMWQVLSGNQQRSIKRVLSGPIGVGKSYLALFLVAKAFLRIGPCFILQMPAYLTSHRFSSVNRDILAALKTGESRRQI